MLPVQGTDFFFKYKIIEYEMQKFPKGEKQR